MSEMSRLFFMNFGGVIGLISTEGSLYSGLRGFVSLLKPKRRYLGDDFSMSEFVKLFIGLFSSTIKGRVCAPTMSHD